MGMAVREIKTSVITDAVARLSQEANFALGEDVIAAIKQAIHVEESQAGRDVLQQLLENARIAKEQGVPLCQDCGIAVIFLEVGQDVHITGGDLTAAVTEGVRQGYTRGYLRKSMVAKSFSERVNTNDNTPPVIHTDIVPGDKIRIAVMTKGGGAENMSRFAMLKPGDGTKGIIDFVLQTVSEAGGNPCPPVTVGVGIGASGEEAMLLAKKALLRPIDLLSPDPEVADLELSLLARINDLGIGPMGYGGRITAFAVHAEVMPSHIASLPVAVNLQCHCARHKEMVL